MAPYELTALLAACRASPADDMPRLVLADWLDEYGDEARATFLRVQVELSHPTANEKRTAELKRIEYDLLTAHHAIWLGNLHEIVSRNTEPEARAFIVPPPNFRAALDPKRHGTSRWRFHRGMLSLTMNPELFEFDQLIVWMQSDLAPWVEQVEVPFGSLSTLEYCKRLHPYSGRLAVAIDATSHLLGYDARGRPLMSGSEQPTPLRWRQFVQSDTFAMLRSLKIQGINGLGMLRELAEAKVVGLVSLELDCRSNLHEAAKITASTPFSALTQLYLGGWDTRTLQILARSRNLRCLQSMNLIGSPIGDAGLIALCESDLAKSVCKISLQNTGIGDAGIEALVRSPLFGRMYGPSLNLMINRIGDAGMIALSRSPELARFTELVMRENQVGDAGIAAFAESAYTKQFTHVDFWRNRITNTGASTLSQSTGLEKIVDLSLKENRITEQAEMIERFGGRVKL